MVATLMQACSRNPVCLPLLRKRPGRVSYRPPKSKPFTSVSPAAVVPDGKFSPRTAHRKSGGPSRLRVHKTAALHIRLAGLTLTEWSPMVLPKRDIGNPHIPISGPAPRISDWEVAHAAGYYDVYPG